jgi:hypothetical protein
LNFEDQIVEIAIHAPDREKWFYGAIFMSAIPRHRETKLFYYLRQKGVEETLLALFWSNAPDPCKNRLVGSIIL